MRHFNKPSKLCSKSGLRVVHLRGGDGADQVYTDEVHKLYDGVLDRAKVRFERLPAEFFQRNRTSRDLVSAAIGRAVGGRTPTRTEPAHGTVVFDNSRHYEVALGKGAQMTNSQLNVGEGAQINVSVVASTLSRAVIR